MPRRDELRALARLHHWWWGERGVDDPWRTRHAGSPFPPRRALWWRDPEADPTIGAIMSECERGLRAERDRDRPFLHLRISLVAFARSRNIPWDRAEDFAIEMLLGRESRRHEGQVISGYLQNPHWVPSAGLWRLRIEDYRPERRGGLDERRWPSEEPPAHSADRLPHRPEPIHGVVEH